MSLQKESEWEEKMVEDFLKRFWRLHGEYPGGLEEKQKKAVHELIAIAVSTREKEIAEEVRKLKEETMPDDEYAGWVKLLHKDIYDEVLSILKH